MTAFYNSNCIFLMMWFNHLAAKQAILETAKGGGQSQALHIFPLSPVERGNAMQAFWWKDGRSAQGNLHQSHERMEHQNKSCILSLGVYESEFGLLLKTAFPSLKNLRVIYSALAKIKDIGTHLKCIWPKFQNGALIEGWMTRNSRLNMRSSNMLPALKNEMPLQPILGEAQRGLLWKGSVNDPSKYGQNVVPCCLFIFSFRPVLSIL